MKVVFENKFEFTEAQINIPFIVGQTPIGIVYEVNKDTFTVQIFDKFIGLEIRDNNIDAIYLSEKEQISYKEFKNTKAEKLQIQDESCILCGRKLGENNLKVCNKCANEYDF